MFRHHLLLAYRNFKRHKSSFFINLIGLSSGLTCVLLIYLWVNDELSMDKFHEKNDRLYQVLQHLPTPNDIRTIGSTPGLLAAGLKQEIPEIENAVSVAFPMRGVETNGILGYDDKRVKGIELFADQIFFEVFSFPWVSGFPNLSDKGSVIISETLASALFGSPDNAVGKVIEWSNASIPGNYTVSCVLADLPANSSLRFDLLFSYELYFDEYRARLEHWGNSYPMTFLVLNKNAEPGVVNSKLKNYVKNKFKDDNGQDGLAHIGTFFLQKFSKRHLYNKFQNGIQTGGRIAYVRLFSIIALFILFIACINFMNLSTAKASGRIKEIGIKKTIGVMRRQLVVQYLTESVLTAFLSMILAIILVIVLLPYFGSVIGKHLHLVLSPGFLLSIIGITLLTGILSGSYPALFISGVKPVKILKNASGHFGAKNNGLWIQKGLVVIQFLISITLIATVLIVYKQIDFIQSKNLGYQKDNIIQIANEGQIQANPEPFLAELETLPGVVITSSFENNFTGDHGLTGQLDWEGKNPEERIEFSTLHPDYDLIELMGLEITDGRSFSKAYRSEESKIIFNETAISAMGLNNPIGKTIKLWGSEKQIIGVVKDFHYVSLYEEIKPCFMILHRNGDHILVKIKSGLEKETLDQIASIYSAFNPGLPFEFNFLDNDYELLYESEQRVAVLSRYFTGIAILISCLGLFGLTAFTAQKRIKEIGIRKVLGSSVSGIVAMFSADFLKLVLIALAVAIPVAWYFMDAWLQDFAYRIEVGWWVFALAGIITVVIAGLTVSFQAIKAAIANPAKSLRSE